MFAVMKKAGRPSSTPKNLRDGYYMLISLNKTSKPVRIMRETIEQVDHVKDKYKNHNFKYLGKVKDHFWVDGENKGKSTV